MVAKIAPALTARVADLALKDVYGRFVKFVDENAVRFTTAHEHFHQINPSGIDHNDTTGLVEDRFAQEADLNDISNVGSILRLP